MYHAAAEHNQIIIFIIFALSHHAHKLDNIVLDAIHTYIIHNPYEFLLKFRLK